MAFRKFARSHVGIINKYGCSVRKHIEEGITGVLRIHPVEIIAQTRIACTLRDYLD